MSERGSFVTEYIYCKECFSRLKEVLLSKDKYLCSTTIPTWEENGGELPIIAGKVGGLYAGEEAHTFEFQLADAIESALCEGCTLTVAVIPEESQYKCFIEYPIPEIVLSPEEIKDMQGVDEFELGKRNGEED